MKRLVLAMIVIWSVVALLLIGLVVSYISGGGSFRPWLTSRNSVTATGQIQTYFDGTFDTKDINNIFLDLSMEDVEVIETEESEIRVVLSGRDLLDDMLLQATKNGSTLKISRLGSYVVSFNLGPAFGVYSKVEVYLPKDYSPDFTVDMSSGSVVFANEFHFSKLDVDMSSGNLRSDAMIHANSANLELTSGRLDFAGLSTDRYFIDVSSGNLDFGALAGYGKIELTSGRITAKNMDIQGDVSIDISSGNIHLFLTGNPSLDFVADTTSGSVKTYFETTRTGEHNNSCKGTVGSAPYHRLELDVTSGSVNIEKQ